MVGRYLAAYIFICAILGMSAGCGRGPSGSSIRVGILHSFTGTMAANEKPVAEATLLAISEINESGGLLGRPIEPVVVDAKSIPTLFGSEAESLISKEGVATIFGCWTSASRKSVKAVVENHDNLLFYPLQHEGLEQSPNIVYTGATPNQQIVPAVKWSFDHLGHRFFLVGSDYLFPRTANTIIKDQVGALGGEIVGEEYLLLRSNEVGGLIAEIERTRPDVILNTINGDSNTAFFDALRHAGITPSDIPTISFTVGESTLADLHPQAMAGDYAAWNYFQSVGSPENGTFVTRFRAKYGASRTLSDPMEAAYFGVYLWAQAVTDANSADPGAIRRAVGDQSMNAPEGLVYIDRETQHTWKTARIGQIRPDGQFDIIWTSDIPVRPVAYPMYRFRSEWDQFLTMLYDGWGGRWANLDTP